MARGLAVLAAAVLTLMALPAQADVVVRGSCPDGDPALVVPWNFATLETCMPALAQACVPAGEVGGQAVPETCVVVPPSGSVPNLGSGPELPDFPPETPELPEVEPPAGLPQPAQCVVENVTADPANVTRCVGVEPPAGVPGAPPLPAEVACVVTNLTADPANVTRCVGVEPPAGVPTPPPLPGQAQCVVDNAADATAALACLGVALPLCAPPATLPAPAPDPLCIPPPAELPPGGDLPPPLACIAAAAQAGSAGDLVACALPPGTLPACVDALAADPTTFNPATCLEGTELPADLCARQGMPDLGPALAALDALAAVDPALPQTLRDTLTPLIPPEPPAQPSDVLGPAGLCPAPP